MKLSAALPFLLVFNAAMATAAQAEDLPPGGSRLDAILRAGVLKVGTTGDYRPFSYFDPAAGSFQGFDIDMAEALGQALGVKVAFVRTSWPSLAKDFGSGAFDMAMGGISITLERQKQGFFSAPILREGKTPIARCADAAKFQTLADIDRPAIRVLTNAGGTNEKFDRSHLRQAEIDVRNDNTKIFQDLIDGRGDLMITDASETRYQQKLHPGALCAIHPDAPFDFSEKAYWLPRDPVLKEFVDQWLHLAIETGVYRTVFDKWLR